MRSAASLLVTLLSILALSSAMLWTPVPNAQRFAAMTSSRMPTIAFIYDSASCSACKVFAEQKARPAPHHPHMKRYRATWATFDMARDPVGAKAQGLEGKLLVRYYRQGRFVDMPNAIELARDVNTSSFDHNGALERIYKFVRDIFESFSKELKEVEDVQTVREILDSGTSVVLYLGKHGPEFKPYYDFATRNTEFKLFHSFTPTVTSEIATLSGTAANSAGNSLIIIRPKGAVQNVPEPRATSFALPLSSAEIQTLVEFEALPKLRDHTYNAYNVQMLGARRHIILLYVRGDPFSLINWVQFKRFVAEMPRTFIFSFSSAKHAENEHYAKLFVEAGVEMQKEKFYVLRRSPAQKLVINAAEGEFTAEALVEFVRDVLQTKNSFLANTADANLDARLRATLDRLVGREQQDEL